MRKNLFLRSGLLIACLVMLTNVMAIEAAEVEAEGRAAGDQKGAREQALADALREAVRKGAGVDILATTGVSNFVLEYDRILSAAFGHVTRYEVLSSGLGADQIYRVRIRAEVEKGTPGAQNLLALRQIMINKGSPRVSIMIDEQIDGVGDGTRYAQGVMEEVARELQMNLVDIETAKASEQKRAARDEIVGDQTDARLRKSDITQKADFLIEGKIVAQYLGQQSFFGSLPQHVFSVGGELRALRPETGEVVVAVALPGTEKIESDLSSKELAARDIIQKLLNKGMSKGELPPLMNRIVAQWVTECDLGSLKRLEFSRIGSEDFRAIEMRLKEHDKIGAVWPREFDSKGISSMDVETRMDSSALGSNVVNSSNGSVSIDRYTESLVVFESGQQGPTGSVGGGQSVVQVGSDLNGVVKPNLTETENTGFTQPAKFNWAWVIGGGVFLVIITGAVIRGVVRSKMES
ncbi:hypothetical protein N9X25_09400 [Verrucomicrobiales bacterium]|nr:hypothetical protein [Verrucomicrobiales bacterium]